jgi:membrane carboxypeptidase/penicillin-binding protein PbpC
VRKIPPGITWCVLLSIVLYACVQPINVNSFLNDPLVQDIINRDRETRVDDDGGIHLGVVPETDRKPALSFPGYNPPVNDIVTVTLSQAASPITFTVTNANVYSNIEWYLNGSFVGSGNSPTTYTIVIPIDFTNTPLWYIIVIGTIGTGLDETRYSTHFSVRVN